MSPITHLLLNWSVASTGRINRKERAIITIAGVVPDIDGLGIIADILTRNTGHPLEWWGTYHHVLAHNLGFGLLIALFAFALSTRRHITSSLAFLSFHLHLFCDLIGSRGPEGYQWPIPYLLPFSNAWQLRWEGQWALNAWPNVVITALALCLVFHLAWKQGFSLLELISTKADQAFVKTLRRRLGTPV